MVKMSWKIRNLVLILAPDHEEQINRVLRGEWTGDMASESDMMYKPTKQNRTMGGPLNYNWMLGKHMPKKQIPYTIIRRMMEKEGSIKYLELFELIKQLIDEDQHRIDSPMQCFNGYLRELVYQKIITRP
jgi:hypothetical protein